MADLKEVVRKALLFLDFKGKTIVLKAKQEKALYRFNSHIPLLPLSISKMVSANVDRAIQSALDFFFLFYLLTTLTILTILTFNITYQQY